MPGSVHRYTLPTSVGRPDQWSFTWNLSDDVTFASCCDFCSQANQRMTYEIRRDSDLCWVCQRCAGRYSFGAMLDQLTLTANDAHVHLNGLTMRIKQQTCHDIIRKAVAGSGDTATLEISLYFDRNLQLSPRHAALLFALLDEVDPGIDKRIFEIQLRSQAHQREYGDLDSAARKLVWPALTPQQQKRITALGFAPRSLSQRGPNSQTRAPHHATLQLPG
ncbi:hypothetical protein DevBK_01675 [Devosia sp. BK]|uniref:hypothetical protein n=1 Tax=Devosia sp. BK TaxID=2871706 RepID=UPI00293ABEE4|nr:hypothetical protein [Devosia sp. BK]MDV3250033.1 hypothetical protein [Devosia sp. BK]